MDNVNFGATHLFDEDAVPDIVVDTGTSYVSLHKGAIKRLQKSLVEDYGFGKGVLNHVANWEHSCTEEQYNSIPDLEWHIHGTAYKLPK